MEYRAGVDRLYSDVAAPCPVCLCTQCRYTVPSAILDGIPQGEHRIPVRVETYCYGCFRTDTLTLPLSWNPSASEVRAEHRIACGLPPDPEMERRQQRRLLSLPEEENRA